ncbi:hypothetical protein [Streptomyces sp. C10-9-1]|uniref:hypothetical protein n=1 Tax=Streptomyces sp. C10-9-1 TaxID=1859285 RepID=UPI003D72A3BC
MTYHVRRARFSRSFPWEWRCAARVQIGAMPSPKLCDAWGLAGSQAEAESRAAAHHEAAHGGTPTAEGNRP